MSKKSVFVASLIGVIILTFAHGASLAYFGNANVWQSQFWRPVCQQLTTKYECQYNSVCEWFDRIEMCFLQTGTMGIDFGQSITYRFVTIGSAYCFAYLAVLVIVSFNKNIQSRVIIAHSVFLFTTLLAVVQQYFLSSSIAGFWTNLFAGHFKNPFSSECLLNMYTLLIVGVVGLTNFWMIKVISKKDKKLPLLIQGNTFILLIVSGIIATFLFSAHPNHVGIMVVLSLMQVVSITLSWSQLQLGWINKGIFVIRHIILIGTILTYFLSGSNWVQINSLIVIILTLIQILEVLVLI